MPFPRADPCNRIEWELCKVRSIERYMFPLRKSVPITREWLCYAEKFEYTMINLNFVSGNIIF